MFRFKKFAVVGSAVVFLSVLNGVGVSGLPAAQAPVTEAVITVFADGDQVGDATSGPAVPGTDDSDSNGVVKNFDNVTYEVEVSLNDADDTNWVSTVVLNDKASWTAVPGECRSVADFPSLVPDSSVSDTTGDGLNDTLVCNHGDHTEGTKLTFKPTAQAVGANLDVMEASVVPSSDNSDPAANRGDGPVATEITAGFGIGIDKTIVSLPPEDEIDYTPQYEPAIVHGTEGKTVNWHIALTYNGGSEFVADNGAGTQSFVIEDTWVGTHSNDPSVEGDNAAGNYSDGLELKNLATGNASDACELIGSNGGTVTCTQAGPGEPITISIDDVPVDQQPLAKVSLKMFYPYEDLFTPNGFAQTETYNIDNRVELVGWGGAGTLVTSETGTVDPGPEVDIKDYLVSASRPGPFVAYKTFDGLATAKSGKRAASRGDIVETSLAFSDGRYYDTFNGVCDTLDTTFFEYAGSLPVGQKDGYLHGGAVSFGTLDNLVNAPVHAAYNPMSAVTGGVGNSADNRETSIVRDGATSGITIEFSDVDYATTGDDHWTATCEDDLTGDGASDWVTDPSTLSGGISSVVRVRMLWDKDFDALTEGLTKPFATARAFFSFDLLIKDTAPIGEYLPNAAATMSTPNSFWNGTWLGTTGGVNSDGNSTGQTYVNVEDDPAESLFSFNNTNADRVYVLPASMSINKAVVPADLGSLASGDTAVFSIDPATSGSNGAPVEMTFTDTLPTGLTYVSDTCTSEYAAIGLTCTSVVSGQTITFSVPGYQVGEDLPAFEVETVVDAGAGSGIYTNEVEIASDLAAFTDTSHCTGSVDSLGRDNEDDCIDTVSAGHSASASVRVVASAGERVEKSDSQVVVEPQADWVKGLTYENLGGSNVGVGQLIDILSYNGDGVLGGNTERFNPASENPANANTETVTADSDGAVEFVSITPSSAGETFEYTTDPHASVDHRPCHPANWPAGDSLGSGNNVLDAICGLGLIDPATDVPTASQAGTGATDWTAAAGPDVTAIRASLPSFPAGQAARTIELVTNVSFAQEGDLLCNNFGLNSDIVTLDLISNDVCVEVVAGSIGDYVWFDTNGDGVQDMGETPIAGVTLKLLDENGDAVLGEDGEPLEAVTDASGNYLFPNLPSGTYTVMVDEASLPPGVLQTFDFDGGLDNMSTTTLEGPATDPTLTDVDDDLDQDFGYQGGSIGDYVWLDADGDGVQDAGETPIGIVTVELLDADGNPVLDTFGNPITTMTNADGLYLFDDLPLGDYIVRIDTTTLPPGLVQTFDSDGGLDNMSPVTIDAANPDNRDQDFGYIPQVFDLALDKVLTTEGPFSVGDTVEYTVAVINQADTTVTNVGVTDFVPVGLTLVEGAGWTLDSDGNAVLDEPIPLIEGGATAEISISFTINSQAEGTVENIAEITEFFDEFGAPAVDADSIPDGDPSNDTLVDGVIDNSSGDEDDSDIAAFELTPEALAATGSTTIAFVGAGLLLMSAGIVVARRRKTLIA